MSSIWCCICHCVTKMKRIFIPSATFAAQKTAQVEGIIIDNKVMYRPRRQLVCQVDDGSGVLCMRFLNFYGSQVKAYANGTRVRLLGEARPGFFWH